MSERPDRCAVCETRLERLRLDALDVEPRVAVCSVRCMELWSTLRANLERALPRRAPARPSGWLVETRDA